MIALHNLSELLLKEMILFPKGNKVITENSGNWTLEINSNWNPKHINLTINSRKSNLYSEFARCLIKKASLISLIARFDNYNFTGKPSEISDLLLASPISINLLKSRRASFELNGKYLIYNCRIGRQDLQSLSNIFILIEKLTKEIDKLTDKKNVKHLRT